MALLMLQDAENTAKRMRPWSLRLEFTGVNANNKNGVSDKYWYATGRGLNEAVEIGWGAVGKKSQTLLTTWAELRNRLPDKLAKGYMYVSHPYVRMSAGNIAKMLGQVPTPPPPSPKTTAPAKKPKQVAVSSQPSSNWVMGAAQKALGRPWDLIWSLQIMRKNTRVFGFTALDRGGKELLKFDVDGGREFARDHNLDIIFI